MIGLFLMSGGASGITLYTILSSSQPPQSAATSLMGLALVLMLIETIATLTTAGYVAFQIYRVYQVNNELMNLETDHEAEALHFDDNTADHYY